MQPTAVIVVADKTSLKRPFIFFNAVNMVLCFFMLSVTVAAHKHILQANKLGEFGFSSVLQLYLLSSGCLLLSVLGVSGALKEKRWCLTLFAAGMAAASQTMIVNTALKYQPVYEKEVINRESSFLSMMPLSENKVNRTQMDSMQAYFKCCGLVEGYKDWGSSIPPSCLCNNPGRRCLRLRGNITIASQKDPLIYQEVVLLVLSIKLMVQIKKKKDFIALLQTHKYCVPGAS
ncbi:tetraspanin-8-like [Diretmus argenteus]